MKLRRYQPIWIALKKDGYVKLTAPAQLHRKIRIMVIKEKYTDVAWKYQQAEAEISMELEFLSQPSGILEIYLRTTSI